MNFEELKAAYSDPNIDEDRKELLIQRMQENLKERCRDGRDSVLCLDGIERSISTFDAENLFAIDGALNSEDKIRTTSDVGERARDYMESLNKYGPNNPYPAN